MPPNVALPPKTKLIVPHKHQRYNRRNQQHQHGTGDEDALGDYSEIFVAHRPLFRRRLRHLRFGRWIQMHLVVHHLLHADLRVDSRKKNVADHRHDDQRHPPALVAALDVLKRLRRRRKCVRNALPLGEPGAGSAAVCTPISLMISPFAKQEIWLRPRL